MNKLVNNSIKIVLSALFLVFVLSNNCFAGTWLNKSNVRNDKNYLTFSIALFDFIQNSRTSIEGRAEFRLYNLQSPLKPLSGIMANSDGAMFLYVGLLYDFQINPFLYITPSFSPGLYFKSSSKELGFALNFRSQLEISVKFENDFRFGLSFNHISNGTLGNINPGVESLALSAQFPL
jgi:hypothetical protein